MDLSRLRRIFSVANILSTCALIFALAGGAYAAGVLPRNSVGTKQLKDRAVTAPKLARGAVDSTKIKDGTVRWQDFAPGDAPIGPMGPAGPPGAQGAPGPASSPAVAIASSQVALPANATAPTAAAVACADGLTVVGGGGTVDLGTPDGTAVLDSAPDGRTGWRVNAINTTADAHNVTVYAQCIAAAKTAP
jgi:hypothetical protein